MLRVIDCAPAMHIFTVTYAATRSASVTIRGEAATLCFCCRIACFLPLPLLLRWGFVLDGEAMPACCHGPLAFRFPEKEARLVFRRRVRLARPLPPTSFLVQCSHMDCESGC
jgi:hypothetical protein